MNVSDAQRVQLRLNVRYTTRTPIAAVDVMPAVTILKVQGRHVHVRVRDASGAVRGRIPQADGSLLHSFVGVTPPAGAEGWTSEGPITKDTAIIAFPATVAVGSRVWVTAQWFNTRGVGPACTPVCTVIGAEGAMAA